MDNRFEDWRIVETNEDLSSFDVSRSIAIDAVLPDVLMSAIRESNNSYLAELLANVDRPKLGLRRPPNHADPNGFDKMTIEILGVYYVDGNQQITRRICPVSITRMTNDTDGAPKVPPAPK